MNIKKIAIFIIIISVIIAVLVFFQLPESESSETLSSFELINVSIAGTQAYAIYSASGSGSINMLALNEKPYERIYIFDKEVGLGIENLADFIQEIVSLESYGFNISVVSTINPVAEESLIVVAQGAMPEPVLSLLDEKHMVLYIGKTDAIISEGLIYEDWYSSLDEYEKSRIILYNSTLEEIYNQEGLSKIKNDIIYNSWALESNKTHVFPEGKGTAVIPFEEASYLRIIYPTSTGYKMNDSEELKKPEKIISLLSAFPSEERSFYITIEDPKGIPKLSVYKDGNLLSDDKLGTVGQNTFFKSLSFKEPGDYILSITDYEREIASGIFHVKDLNVTYLGSDGVFYKFNISVDGVPVDSKEAVVSLLGSENSMNMSVYNGLLVVPAKLKQGDNTFIIEIYGQEVNIDINYSSSGVLDIYIGYGPWVALIVIVVYAAVVFTRRQPYKIRFDSAMHLTSAEIKLRPNKIQKIIPKSISEFGSNGCISAREFSLALRKYLTDGYDVMDGNAESILKSFEKQGYLESHRSFYMIKGKENVKNIVMDRLIREKLIEQGITFNYKNGIFQTKDQLITFAAGRELPKSKAKLILVFENSNSVSNYLSSLPQKEKSKTALRIRNGALLLLSINELADYL